MSSKVVLQALDSRTFKLALRDVRFAKFNEKLTGLEPENWRFMHTPEPEETTSEYKTVLESPVEFTMVEGEIKEIKSSEEEATWTINFKKSLISLIKIQSPSGRIDISQNNVRTETGRLPEIWSVMEEGVDGECENTYQFIEVPTYMLSELTHGKMGMETCEERGLKAYQITKTRNVAKSLKQAALTYRVQKSCSPLSAEQQKIVSQKVTCAEKVKKISYTPIVASLLEKCLMTKHSMIRQA